MRLSTIKLFLIALVNSLLVYSVHADNATQPAPSFQENCVNSWVKKGDKAIDKVADECSSQYGKL